MQKYISSCQFVRRMQYKGHDISQIMLSIILKVVKQLVSDIAKWRLMKVMSNDIQKTAHDIPNQTNKYWFDGAASGLTPDRDQFTCNLST